MGELQTFLPSLEQHVPVRFRSRPRTAVWLIRDYVPLSGAFANALSEYVMLNKVEVFRKWCFYNGVSFNPYGRTHGRRNNVWTGHYYDRPVLDR